MSSPDTPHVRRRSLADLVESIESAANPVQAVLEQTLAQLQLRDADLAECVRYGAIPRELDATLLGVLRGTPEDRAGNQRLLDGLRSLTFVSSTSRGGCRYHDATRQWILDEWCADSTRKAVFDTHNQSLVRYFEDQHGLAKNLEQDLERVKELLLRTHPPRFVQFFTIVERRLIAPLVEALYHESLRSVGPAYDAFARHFQAAENLGRYQLCESLLEAATHFIGQLPSSPEQTSRLKWLRYYEARLALRMGRFDRSEELLRALRDEVGDEVVLKLWVLGELGSALHNQYRLREARDCFHEELELKRETREDLYNLSVSQVRLAGLHWALGELDQAAAEYRAAIRAAQEKNLARVDVEASARLYLSGVLQEDGQWDVAFDLALEALYLARTALSQDRSIAQSVVGQLMTLVARRDPALLDVLYREAHALLGAVENPPQELRLGKQYLDLLRDSGRLAEADQLLAQLKARSVAAADTQDFTDLLVSEALLHEEHGRLDDSIRVYQSIIDRHDAGGAATPWHRGAAISNQGLNRASLGRLDEAEAQLQPAISHWRENGVERLAAFVQTFLANALRRHGQPGRAQSLLDEAASTLRDAQVSYRAQIEFAHAELAYALAQWEKARQHHEAAVRLNASIDQHKSAARSHSLLATIASDQGRWPEASAHAAEAGRLWQLLAARNRLSASPVLNHAAALSATGVQRFTEYGTARGEQVQQAADLFRKASQEAPDQFWYPLNLAFAYADAGDWERAIQALETARGRAPEWARSNIFLEWLAEFHLKQGEGFVKQGQIDGAAEALRRSRASLQQAPRESRVSAHRLAQLHLRLGDGFFSLGRVDEALAQYQTGLPLVDEGTHLSLHASLHARLALCAADRADPAEAFGQYRLSLDRRRDDGAGDPAAALVEDCSRLTTSWPAFHSLAAFLRACGADATRPPEERRQIRNAWFELSRSRYRTLLRGPGADAESAATSIPVVTPIALEADAGFLPDNDTVLQEQLINVEAPAMRTRLMDTLGLRSPGVSLRSNVGLGPGVYVLLLDEIPLVSGSVVVGQKFCPDAARCRSLGIPLSETRTTSDQREGAWVPVESQAQAENAGLVLWEPFHFVFRELETLIRRNAVGFFGVQELENTLDTWAKESNSPTLRQSALPDNAARMRFLQLLQALLEEEVPILDLTRLLTVFAAHNPQCPEVGDIVEHARRELCERLAGNEPVRRAVALSPGFEAEVARWVQTLDGKSFLAVPPETAQELLAAFRAGHTEGPASDWIVVVRQARLRPFVRRLLGLEWPAVPVLSWQERMDHNAAPVRQVELAGGPAATGAPGTLTAS